MYPSVVVVVECAARIASLASLMSANSRGQTYSLLSVWWNYSMCPFCSGVLT